MPYNSSAFEKQLAKYKQGQAEKLVADMPRRKYEHYGDTHQVRSRIPADRGTIHSNALDPMQLMGEGAQTSPVIRPGDPIKPLIVTKKRKKPFYARSWFILLVVTTLPTLAAPILFKDQTRQLMDTVASIRTSTGVDPLSVKTYTDMIRHRKSDASPDDQASSILDPQPEQVKVDPSELAQPMDMHNAVQRAQDKANSITAKGTNYSMKYIEEETRRLNDEAKKFDEQYHTR